MTLQTPICDLFGIEFPVFSAGMGVGAGAALAAAVSNAGGCGVIGGHGRTNNGLRNEIRQMRALSSKPFGVNLLPAVAREGMIDACIEERPPIIVLFLGDPTPWIGKAQQSGIKIVVQVGTVEEARTAARAGADAIIAQGVEAGGHVQATVSLATNLPAIVQAVSPLPVLGLGRHRHRTWPCGSSRTRRSGRFDGNTLRRHARGVCLTGIQTQSCFCPSPRHGVPQSVRWRNSLPTPHTGYSVTRL